jgi:hypothetical protein
VNLCVLLVSLVGLCVRPVLVSLLLLALLPLLSACVLVRVCVCGLQCDLEMSLRQGGYTTRFTGLKFINTPRRVRWTSPFKEIVLVCSGALSPYRRPPSHACTYAHELPHSH